MPTLKPTIMGWAEGTPWHLARISYNYDGNPHQLQVMGREMEIIGGTPEEWVEVDFIAAGLHKTGMEIPDTVSISDGYSGISQLTIRDRKLVFETDSGEYAGLYGFVENGITTFSVSGVIR